MPVARGTEPVSVFIIDADPVQRRLITAHLGASSERSFAPIACESLAEALAACRRDGKGVVLADLESIGGADALGGLAGAQTAVIATSARSSLHSAVAAMRAGAVDFMPKPIGAVALLDRLRAAVESWDRQAPVAIPVEAPSPDHCVPPQAAAGIADFEGFLGASAPMRQVYTQIERIAPSRAPVFITGESGTGKEVCAEAIHQRGGSGIRPFIALNCSAIPKDLIESEIFGHMRGAFTGAVESRPGAAELADGGTLFLDEIGEMELGLQAKLLRFIQTGIVRRVGDTESRRVDVRFVCATNRDPLAEVRAGRFRADLYYRLNVLPISLPALRERPQDVMRLAEAFLAAFAREEGRGFRGFDHRAAERLIASPWPGNVRQLQNVIRRIVVLHDGALVTEAMLPPDLASADEAGPMADTPVGPPFPVEPFWQQERRIIEAALSAFDGNTQRAAAALEISPSTIYRKRQAWAERRTA